MADNLPFTNLDFQNVKNNLKEYLRSQTQFADYDFEGSNMNVLLDILAYNTFQNNYYTNMAISEMFLDSAQLRDSVVSHAKELGYLPRSRRAARAVIDLEIFPTDTPGSIVIPEQTSFTARCGNATYKFYNREGTVITPSGGRYVAYNLPVYEGEFIEEIFVVNNNPDQKIAISNFAVDTTSVRVYIKDNVNTPESEEVEYVFKENIYDVASDDNVFYLQPYLSDRYEITFGQNTFGAEPVAGNIIRVVYQRTSGSEANGIGLMELTNRISNYSSAATVINTSNGGAEPETLESIKYFAPRSIQVQNRAVTTSDYKVLIRNNFPEIKSVSVYGGENLFPPQFGRVIVACDAVSGDGISENTRDKIQNFLRDKSALAIEPVIINSKFMYLEVASTVYYNRNTTSQNFADIGQKVSNVITQYSFNNLEEYEKNFKYSRFSTAIDNADTNITSNDTTVTPFMEIFPRLNFSSYFILQFQNEIDSSLPYNASALTQYEPGVYSTTFTYNGNSSAFIQDNGSGQLNIVYRTSDGGVSLLENNVGTVDYDSGDVILRYISIQNYSTAGIKVYARLRDKRITAPFDRILRIRPIDVSVQVVGIRE